MKLLMQIRPGEGGDDAKLLVTEQAKIYVKYAERIGAKVEFLDEGLG